MTFFDALLPFIYTTSTTSTMCRCVLGLYGRPGQSTPTRVNNFDDRLNPDDTIRNRQREPHGSSVSRSPSTRTLRSNGLPPRFDQKLHTIHTQPELQEVSHQDNARSNVDTDLGSQACVSRHRTSHSYSMNISSALQVRQKGSNVQSSINDSTSGKRPNVNRDIPAISSTLPQSETLPGFSPAHDVSKLTEIAPPSTTKIPVRASTHHAQPTRHLTGPKLQSADIQATRSSGATPPSDRGQTSRLPFGVVRKSSSNISLKSRYLKSSMRQPEGGEAQPGTPCQSTSSKKKHVSFKTPPKERSHAATQLAGQPEMQLPRAHTVRNANQARTPNASSPSGASEPPPSEPAIPLDRKRRPY